MRRMTVVIGILIAGINGCVTEPCIRDEENMNIKNGGVGEPISCIQPPPQVLTPNDIAP